MPATGNQEQHDPFKTSDLFKTRRAHQNQAKLNSKSPAGNLRRQRLSFDYCLLVQFRKPMRRISEILLGAGLLWLLLAAAGLVLLVTTNVLQYVLGVIAMVLILNGLYHALLLVWQIGVRLASIVFGFLRPTQ